MPEGGTPVVRFDGAQTAASPGSIRFDGFVRTVVAHVPSDVVPALAEVEEATRWGLHAAGFVAHEAASSLTPHLPSLPSVPGLPLLWFALYRERTGVRVDSIRSVVPRPVAPPLLTAAMSGPVHRKAVEAIRARIRDGDCYQANVTFPMEGRFDGEPLLLYEGMIAAQRCAFGAYLDTGRFVVASASPELFFSRRRESVVTRPMKGTSPRGRFPAEDTVLSEALGASEKERAGNLMIVDLIRNDLGAVAVPGSVSVPSLFAIESFPTVHQMTSTVTASLRPGLGLVDLFRALFPCGSVTGAPKRRAMEIIAGLEGRPRGVYCGAIGFVSPGEEAVFSVAIRTLLVDREMGTASLGVGGGITWESDPAEEYRECLVKVEFLRRAGERTGLIESIRVEGGEAPFLARHLDRMEWSAGRLGISFDRGVADAFARRLAAETATGGSGGVSKARLHLGSDGHLSGEAAPIVPDAAPMRVAFSTGPPVDPDDPSLYMKTDCRDRYEKAKAERPDADEVILLNTRGEVTEGTYHSVVAEVDGRLVTPPLSCGLLPGVMRGELLARGEAVEGILRPDDVRRASRLVLVNAVRGRRPAILLPG